MRLLHINLYLIIKHASFRSILNILLINNNSFKTLKKIFKKLFYTRLNPFPFCSTENMCKVGPLEVCVFTSNFIKSQSIEKSLHITYTGWPT